MRRLHLFEIEDQPWLPAALRDYMTDFLRFILERFDLLAPAGPVLARLLRQSGERRVLDVASGGGGAWLALVGPVRREVPDLRVTFSDLYPNHAALADVVARDSGALTFEPRPIDATAVPADRPGVRSHFLSLHHFRPPEAERILGNAVRAGAPIAVFEAQRRNLAMLFKIAPMPLFVVLLTPFLRPFRWGRLFFTYVIPLVPLLVLWDGWVSVWRTYEPEEMLALAAAADPDEDFSWESGILRRGILDLPYLTGRPTNGESPIRRTHGLVPDSQ